jgi:hypothetical protein
MVIITQGATAEMLAAAVVTDWLGAGFIGAVCHGSSSKSRPEGQLTTELDD